MIYVSLIDKIDTTLQAVPAVQKIIRHPVDENARIDGYPAVIFFPSGFENSFETVSENMKVYRFKMYVVVGTEQTTMDMAMNTVLAETVDGIIAQFDADWDGGDVGGHRMWVKVDSGDWTVSNNEKGVEVVAELNVDIRLLTNN